MSYVDNVFGDRKQFFWCAYYDYRAVEYFFPVAPLLFALRTFLKHHNNNFSKQIKCFPITRHFNALNRSFRVRHRIIFSHVITSRALCVNVFDTFVTVFVVRMTQKSVNLSMRLKNNYQNGKLENDKRSIEMEKET